MARSGCEGQQYTRITMGGWKKTPALELIFHSLP